MKKTIGLFFVFAVSFLLLAKPAGAQSRSPQELIVQPLTIPLKGFVPDEATAIAKAEAILVPIYGQESIDGQKPFLVSLENDVWTIWGHRKQRLPGGVFRIQISKQHASVISLTHGK